MITQDNSALKHFIFFLGKETCVLMWVLGLAFCASYLSLSLVGTAHFFIPIPLLLIVAQILFVRHANYALGALFMAGMWFDMLLGFPLSSTALLIVFQKGAVSFLRNVSKQDRFIHQWILCGCSCFLALLFYGTIMEMPLGLDLLIATLVIFCLYPLFNFAVTMLLLPIENRRF